MVADIFNIDISSWTKLDSPFCEYYQNGNTLPEYSNAYTSLAYALSAFISWYLSHIDFTNMGKMINSSLLILGLSSFIFHQTLWAIIGNIDVFSMLFLSYLGSYLFVEITLCFLVLSRLIRHKILFFVTLIYITGFIIAISIWSLSPSGNALAIVTAIPQLITFVCIFIFLCAYHHAFIDVSNRFSKRAINYMMIGVVILIAVGLIAVFVEPACIADANSWTRNFIFSHGLWHIGSAYSIHILFHSFTYFQLLLSGQKCAFRESKGFWEDIFFTVFPCVVTKLNPDDTCCCFFIDFTSFSEGSPQVSKSKSEDSIIMPDNVIPENAISKNASNDTVIDLLPKSKVKKSSHSHSRERERKESTQGQQLSAAIVKLEDKLKKDEKEEIVSKETFKSNEKTKHSKKLSASIKTDISVSQKV